MCGMPEATHVLDFMSPISMDHLIFSPHLLLEIYQWKLRLAVAVGSDPYTTWDLCN